MGVGDEQELCAYCMLFLFVLSLSVYILAELLCCMYPGHSKVGGLSDGKTDDPSNARLEPSSLRPEHFQFMARVICACTAESRNCTPTSSIYSYTYHTSETWPSTTSLTIMGRNNYLYPSTPVSLHLYPSTLPLILSGQEMGWEGQGWGVGGGLKPCWLQS